MSITIIDHALKGLVRTGRVIIGRYREDCLAQCASDLALALSTQAVPGLLAARQSVQHSFDGLFKCIPFNGKAAF